jgi:predicted  nucleic acid-binding Zn-ribbon protein
MKVLMLNGSPKAHGNTAMALAEMEKVFAQEGIETEMAPQIAEYEAQAEAAKAKIDERLIVAYNRIRRNVRNGLAVVTVQRDSCGGCFNHIPPQRQADIRQGKKLIVCEYCGRILVAE